MAIFNECTTDFLLLEKATREEYRKRSFKKKYNYEPSKEDPDVGTITDKQGKKYRVDMKNKNVKMAALTGKENSDIEIGKSFWKLKGSHKNERRDAVFQHEIEHQNLHNLNSDNKTVDKDKRSKYTFRKNIEHNIKNKQGIDINSSDDDAKTAALKLYEKSNDRIRNAIRNGSGSSARELIYKGPIYREDNYLKNTKDSDQKNRDADYKKAEKYEKKNNSHTIPEEFEADRYAANRTSEKALKKGLREYNRKDAKITKDKEYNQKAEVDYNQRMKALKDKDLRNAKTYK